MLKKDSKLMIRNESSIRNASNKDPSIKVVLALNCNFSQFKRIAILSGKVSDFVWTIIRSKIPRYFKICKNEIINESEK